jgi:hypothetical protein
MQFLTHSQRFQWMAAVVADRKFTPTQKNVLIKDDPGLCAGGEAALSFSSSASPAAGQPHPRAARRSRAAVSSNVSGGSARPPSANRRERRPLREL